MATVLTIGHSNRPIEQFLELCAEHQILVLADIRRFPGSRKHPQFNRESLVTTLVANRIGYEWIEELGGRRHTSAGNASPNDGLRNQSFRNFADYMQTPQFRRGVDKLLEMAERGPAAIMCAEGLWWQCHRRLVSDFLQANGHNVEHIFPNGQIKPHVLTPEAQKTAGGVIYPAEKALFDEDGPHS